MGGRHYRDDDGTGQWFKPRRRDWRLACCDCGLVHTIDFKLVPMPNGGQAIWMRARRHERATAARRRQRGR